MLMHELTNVLHPATLKPNVADYVEIVADVSSLDDGLLSMKIVNFVANAWATFKA